MTMGDEGLPARVEAGEAGAAPLEAPSMDRGRFRRLEDLFHGARGRAPGEREAFLERECDGDRELLEEVRGLIAHEPRTALPLEPAAPGGFGDIVGERLGAFRLLRLLGEGGMGAVFEAEEEHPRRRVALKVLRLASASASARSRFMREIRLLAGLQHPGIAAIYEAGVARRPGGPELPFFAMELVQGARLDEFARQRRPSLEERLALVAEICDAVQHAHQRGVIHRDLKPGNILVVEDPGRAGAPRPKVLDFGIARATEGESETALLTRAGQILGTLAYMSPEQVLGDPAEQDTRSDVYSLGVILYELVCGRLPLDLDTSALPEAARRIREEEPERPARLAPGLRGDVETIVLKALEKDRERRYQSAAELAEDLRRHLRGEPIAARSHSALYVLRRTMRRHRAATGVALVFFLSVLVFAFYAAHQARVKGRLAEEISHTAASLEEELSRSRLERGYLSTQLGALEAAETQLWREFLSSPDSEENLWALRNLYQRFPCVRTARIAPFAWSEAIAHPDPTRIIVASAAGPLYRVEVPDLRAAEVGAVREGGPHVSLSLESGLLCQLGYAGDLDLYELGSLDPLGTLELGCACEGVAFLPGGSTILAGGIDGRLFEIAVPALEVTREVRLRTGLITVIAYDARSERIAVGGADGKLLILTRDGTVLEDIQASWQNLSAIAFSSDGSRIVTGGWDKVVRCWDSTSGEHLATMDRSIGGVQKLEFVGESDVVRASGWWSCVEWNVSAGGVRTVLPIGVDALLPVEQGRLLLTLTSGVLRLWRPAILGEPDALAPLEGRSVGRFDRSEERAILGDAAGHVFLAELERGGTRLFQPDGNRAVAVAMDSAEGVLWVGRNNQIRVPNPGSEARLPPKVLDRAGFVSLLDLETGEERAAFSDFMSLTPRSLDIAPDSTLVAFPRWGAGLEVRDARTAELVRCFPPRGPEIVSVRFSPDGTRLAYVQRDQTIGIADLRDGSERAYPRPEQPWVVAFHPDGRRLIFGCWDGRVGILDAGSGELLGVLAGHSSTIWDVAPRPERPDQVATASADGSVRLWQISTGRLLLLLETQGWEATSVDFSRDGRKLLVAGANGMARCVDLRESLECVGGNLDHQLGSLGPELGLDPEETALRLRARLGRALRSE
jgi:serine/threonine protein kinase/WD40 repeat protein